MSDEVENTDREIWRGPDEGNGSYYADSVHITNYGGLGINCGGRVIVKAPRAWHEAADALSAAQAENARKEATIETHVGMIRDMRSRIDGLEAEIARLEDYIDTLHGRPRRDRARSALSGQTGESA